MKRIYIVIGLTLVLALSVIMIDDARTAERPKGSKISGYILHTTTVDSTSEVQRDTTTTPSGSNTYLAYFTDVDDYTTVQGWFVSEYVTVDTGTGGVAVDTTKDTVITRMYTADESGTPYKLIWTDTSVAFHVSASVVNADYNSFDVSDSTLWDVVYIEVITSLQDSVFTKARLVAGLDWKTSWKLYAK